MQIHADLCRHRLGVVSSARKTIGGALLLRQKVPRRFKRVKREHEREAAPAAGHAGAAREAQDLAQAPLKQLRPLSMLLPEQLQEAAHEGCMHVCMGLLLPHLILLFLLHLLCSTAQ